MKKKTGKWYFPWYFAVIVAMVIFVTSATTAEAKKTPAEVNQTTLDSSIELSLDPDEKGEVDVFVGQKSSIKWRVQGATSIIISIVGGEFTDLISEDDLPKRANPLWTTQYNDKHVVNYVVSDEGGTRSPRETVANYGRNDTFPHKLDTSKPGQVTATFKGFDVNAKLVSQKKLVINIGKHPSSSKLIYPQGRWGIETFTFGSYSYEEDCDEAWGFNRTTFFRTFPLSTTKEFWVGLEGGGGGSQIEGGNVFLPAGNFLSGLSVGGRNIASDLKGSLFLHFSGDPYNQTISTPTIGFSVEKGVDFFGLTPVRLAGLFTTNFDHFGFLPEVNVGLFGYASFAKTINLQAVIAAVVQGQFSTLAESRSVSPNLGLRVSAKLPWGNLAVTVMNPIDGSGFIPKISVYYSLGDDIQNIMIDNKKI